MSAQAPAPALRIAFPPHLSPSSALDFSRQLFAAHEHSVVEIDFTHSRWLPPFAALLVSSEIVRFKAQHSNVKLVCSNYQAQSYGAHIGFFRSFGLSWGNWPGEATGNDNYLPITFVDCAAIRDTASVFGDPAGSVVELLAEKITPLLVRTNSGQLFDVLAYSLREMMRNVVEHSGTSRLAYCAQCWPTNGRIEVGVLDWGIGLRASLLQNPSLVVPDDAEAIRLALMPGVSGKGEMVKKLKVKSVWTNSGYGLYMTSRLCRNGGSFLIGSGRAAATLAGGGVSEFKWGPPGTAVKMEIRVDRLNNLQEMLERFRREAESFRNSVAKSEFLTASMTSRALHDDFAESF